MLNISKTIYSGWSGSASTTELPEAELIPYGNSSNEKKKLSNFTRKHTIIKEHDNIPLPGFTLYKSDRKYYGSLDSTWLVIDPRGFLIRITSKNLENILHVTGITEGLIQEKCVWARENSETKMTLVPVSSTNFVEAVENTELIEGKVDMKEVQIGDTVLLQNTLKGEYVGVLSMYGPMNDFSFSLEFKPLATIRRQIIETSPGVYYHQADLKILKVIDKTSTPGTREGSADKINKLILEKKVSFTNDAAHVISKLTSSHSYFNDIRHVSTHAVPKVPMVLEEITISEARTLFDSALKTSDFGILMIEDAAGIKNLIDFPYEYSKSNLVNVDAFDISRIQTLTTNDAGHIEKIMLASRRKSIWSSRPAPGIHRLDNFKKFYKLVKYVKTANYI